MNHEVELVNVIGNSGYAAPMFAFLLFGVFSLLLQGLLLKRFFPFPISSFVCVVAVGIALIQWLVLIADVSKYDLPWYRGLLDPFRILLDAEVYKNLGFIFGMAIPSVGIIGSSLSAIVVCILRINDREFILICQR